MFFWGDITIMKTGLAAVIAMLLFGPTWAQYMLGDKGWLFPSLLYDTDCAVLAPPRIMLQPAPEPRGWHYTPPRPPFLGARPPVPHVPPISPERAFPVPPRADVPAL